MVQFESNLMQANEKVTVVDPIPQRNACKSFTTDSQTAHLPSLSLNRSTANRLQRYKAISRSTHIHRFSFHGILFTLADVCYLRIYFFLSIKSPEIWCFSTLAVEWTTPEIHLAYIHKASQIYVIRTRITVTYTISGSDCR